MATISRFTEFMNRIWSGKPRQADFLDPNIVPIHASPEDAAVLKVLVAEAEKIKGDVRQSTAQQDANDRAVDLVVDHIMTLPGGHLMGREGWIEAVHRCMQGVPHSLVNRDDLAKVLVAKEKRRAGVVKLTKKPEEGGCN